MNRAVLHYINKYLSNYLENISSDQLEVSIFSGRISMENVRVKPHVLQLIGLPFDLKLAKLGKININYYFSAILSKPITIEISEILAFISPVESSKWSEGSLKDLLLSTKQMKLDQFETLLEAEINESSLPGFIKRWLLKIIDNTQISIEKLYIRYEDSVTSSNKFNFGVLLKSLKASTCDYNWEKTLTPKNQKFCYKSIEINSFAVFNDFDVETTIFQDVYKESLEDGFNLLVTHEVNGEIQHNYIVEPFSIEVKAQINKSFDKNAPLINIQVDIPQFMLSFYDGQIASGLHVNEFVKLFLTFLVGVDKTINFKFLTEEEEKAYTEIYVKYRKAQKNNKTRSVEKIRKKLIELEKNVNYASIIELRTAVVSNIVKSKLIKEKAKEINKIEEDLRGRFSKFKSLFQKMSELEYAAKEQEAAAKIDEAIKEIDRINENSVVNLKKQKKGENWLKLFVEINVGCISACMYSQHSPLFKLEMDAMKLVLGLKSGIFLEFNLASTQLKDLYNTHPKFPYFFDMGKVWMYLEDDPLKLEFTGGDVYIYCLTNKILNIATILKNLFIAKADISAYAFNIQESYKDYLESGKDYLNFVFKKGQAALPDIKVNCKAPVIVFPGNLEKTNDYIAINSGQIVANTLLASQEEVHYYFELKNFEIFMMSSFKQSVEKKELIISLEFLSCSFLFDIAGENIKLGLNINEIFMTLNPRSLRLMNDLQRKLKKLIPKIMIVSNVNTERQTSAPSNTVKYEGIQVFIHFNLRKVYLVVIEDEQEFFEVGASRVIGEINVEKTQVVTMQYKVKEFYAKDLKHASSFLKFFSDPYPDLSDYQIVLKIIVDPNKNLNHLSISVNSIRIIIYSEFIESLMNYYNKNSNELQIPMFDFVVPSQDKSYSVNTAFYLQMSIMCHKVEIWFPSKLSSDCVTFDMLVHMDFKQTIKYRVNYSASGLPTSQILTMKKEEMELLASHISASLINTDQTGLPQQFLYPFRAYLQLESSKNEIYPDEVLKMSISVGTMDFCVQVQQIEVFIKLGFDWMFFFMPGLAIQAYKQSELYMDIDVNTFNFHLVSKTSTLDHLCKAELRYSHVNFIQNQEGQNIKCRSQLGLIFYNRKMTQWQAIIEKVPILLNLKINGELIEPDVKIYEGLNINVTYELVEVALELVNEFLFKKQLPKKEVKKNERFVVQNVLDKSIFLWLDLGQCVETMKVKEKSKVEFDSQFIENARKNCKVSVKWTHQMELEQFQVKIGFSFSENQATAVFFHLDETDTKIFSLFEEKVVVLNSFKESFRLLTFNSGVFVVDQTAEPADFQSLTKAELNGYSGNNFPTLAGKVNIKEIQTYCTDLGYNIIIDNYEAYLGKQSVNIIEIVPELLVKNSLKEKITIVDEYDSIIQEVDPNTSQALKINKDKLYSVKFFKENKEFITKPSKLVTSLNNKSLLHLSNYPGSSLVLKTKRTEFDSIEFLKPFKKQFKKNSNFSQTTEIYSEYLLINSSQMDLDVSGVVISRNSSAYFSDLDKSVRIKSLKPTSQSSESFKINTVGLSGVVKTRDSSEPESLVSVKISQSEGHTKLVKFAPRFILWNLLSDPLFISDDFILVELTTGQDKENFQFLDNLNENRNIRVSLDRNSWTDYFVVDEINDFQIRVKSNCQEFDSDKWYLPGFSNDYHRVVRVVISTDDEAVIHICFANPVDPDFLIVNKTEEPLFVSQFQSLNRDQLMVPPFEAKPWAWPSQSIKPKKLQINLLNSTQSYSFEKVKSFKNKPIHDCGVSVVVNGSTRELWVKSRSYSDDKLRKTTDFFVVTKEASQHKVENPRFAIKGLVPLPELIESMQTNIVKHIARKNFVTLNAYLGQISINLYSPDLSHLINVSINGLAIKGKLDTYMIDNKTKISSKLETKLKKLQVYSLESHTKEQESIFMLSPGKDQEVALGFLLDHEVILKVTEAGIDQKHKVEHFELGLGIVNVKVNEQSIYSVLSFLEFFTLLQPFLPPPTPVCENFSVPEINLSKVGKVYIKMLKLSPVKIQISIKKAGKKPNFSVLSQFYFYPMLRMVGSTFLSEKEVVLNFNEASIQNVFQSFEHFSLALGKQYISQGIKQFYSVLGFLDLLANPVKLMESIGNSVFDLIKGPSSEPASKSTFAHGLQKKIISKQ